MKYRDEVDYLGKKTTRHMQFSFKERLTILFRGKLSVSFEVRQKTNA